MKGDSCNQRRTSTTENVFRGIEITIMYRTALTARPFPYSKACDTSRPRIGHFTTIRTGLGGEAFVHFDIPRAMPNGLVRQHFSERRPAGIKHGLRQAGSGESASINIADSDVIKGASKFI